MNIQYWFPLGLTALITLKFKVLSRIFSNTTVQKHQFFGSAFFMIQFSYPYTTTRQIIALTRWTYVGKVMSLLFNMLSRFVIAFLPRSKRLLISWLQSPPAVILESKKVESTTLSTAFPSIFHEVMGADAMILVFWMLSFKLAFSDGYIFPFLLCLLILFFSQLFVRPTQTTFLPFCISFPWWWS